MAVHPIPPLARRVRGVSAEVAAHLEQLIATDVVRAGERLPSERDLAATLQVSRATVREALTELESKRLIERHQGRGSVVVDRGSAPEELRDGMGALDVELHNVTEIRELVEPRIAALAARRAAPSNVMQLEDVVARSSEHLSAEESLRLDRAFHELLAHAAQNPLLVALSGMTDEWTVDLRGRSHATKRARRISVEGHREILAAVASGDEEAAERAMAAHLRDVRTIIERERGRHDDQPLRRSHDDRSPGRGLARRD